jgi:alpha-D-ribose 1-methylphosphonate 5-triphosphate diphosphatase
MGCQWFALSGVKASGSPDAMTVLANAQIVLPDTVLQGAVRLDGDHIAAIEPGRMTGDIDCAGNYLLPGLIDLHTDAIEKHYQPRPGVNWPPMAAAMAHDAQIATAGITTVFDALNFGTSYRNLDRAAALEPLLQGLDEAETAGALRAQHFLHARCEITDPDTVGLLEPFLGSPRLRFMSLMDHAPGQRQSPDIAVYRARHMASMNLSEAAMDAHIAAILHRSEVLAPDIRARLVAIARQHALPLSSHDDETVAHVEQAAAEGMVLSEFPTTMAAAEAARRLGLVNLMGGPNVVRGGSTYGNVSALELAEAGLLDVLASDYVPASLLHAVFVLSGCGAADLPTATSWATSAPAKAAGLDDRGRIEPGLRADLIQVQLAGATPVVRATYVAGRRVA